MIIFKKIKNIFKKVNFFSLLYLCTIIEYIDIKFFAEHSCNTIGDDASLNDCHLTHLLI